MKKMILLLIAAICLLPAALFGQKVDPNANSRQTKQGNAKIPELDAKVDFDNLLAKFNSQHFKSLKGGLLYLLKDKSNHWGLVTCYGREWAEFRDEYIGIEILNPEDLECDGNPIFLKAEGKDYYTLFVVYNYDDVLIYKNDFVNIQREVSGNTITTYCYLANGQKRYKYVDRGLVEEK